MPIFNNLIKPMRSVIIKDVIAELLQSEVEAQEKIALSLGCTKKFIRQNISFNVHNNKFTRTDPGAMPCVLIFPVRIDFNDSVQDMSMCKPELELCVEMYCAGTCGIDENGEVISSDTNAASRLDYLTSQVFAILMSQFSTGYFSRRFIESMVIKDWVLLKPEKQCAETILGARFTFELKTKETFQTLTGTEMKELYVELNVRDEFVNTIIKQIFKI